MTMGCCTSAAQPLRSFGSRVGTSNFLGRRPGRERDTRGLPAPGPPVMNDRRTGQARTPDGLLHGEMLRKRHFYAIVYSVRRIDVGTDRRWFGKSGRIAKPPETSSTNFRRERCVCRIKKSAAEVDSTANIEGGGNYGDKPRCLQRSLSLRNGRRPRRDSRHSPCAPRCRPNDTGKFQSACLRLGSVNRYREPRNLNPAQHRCVHPRGASGTGSWVPSRDHRVLPKFAAWRRCSQPLARWFYGQRVAGDASILSRRKGRHSLRAAR